MKTILRPYALFSLALVTFLALAPQARSQTCSGNTVTFTNQMIASGIATGTRVELDGVTSSCGGAGSCGVPLAGTFRYITYTFVNNTGGASPDCFTVDFTTTCVSSEAVASAAYLGSFDPANICNANYLADRGLSTQTQPLPYSFNVANGATFVVVVWNRISGTFCASPYTLAISSPSGCPTVSGFCPTITGTVSGSGSICAGSSKNVSVTVSGGTAPYTVVLNNSGGTQSGTGPTFNFSVSPGSTTTYSVDSVASHDNGSCPITGSGSATVTVNANPGTPTITATPSQVCANSPGNQASAPASSGYAWSIAGGTITSAANIQTITYAAGGGTFVTLDLTVTNASGCTAANSRNVPINAAPATPTITPTPSSLCANSTGNQASGPAGATTYSWTISNGTITSATNIQTITYNAGASGNVGLTLRVSNGSGCNATNSTNVAINALPATPTITPTPSSVTANSTGNQASGPAGATTYSWTISNGTVTSATNIQTITYTAGASGNVGLTLRVSNAGGCLATNSANVPINIPPVITSATNTTFTVGINGVFNVTRTGTPTPDLFMSGTFPNGVGFNPGTGNLAGTPAAGTGGTYPLVITATNAAGTNVQNFTLTVLQSPALSCPPNITTNAAGPCPRTIAFAATVTGGFPAPTLSYKIGTNVITSPYAFPIGTNIVTATATNSAGTNSCNFTVTVAAGAAPQLTVLGSGTNIVLCWSNIFACYALQYTTQLLSPPSTNVWTVHPGPLVPSGGNIYATNGVGTTNRFFRLAF